MLPDNDLRIDIGRASHRGDFMRLKHVPTGLSRCHPGPLGSINRRALVENWRAEIKAELRERGLSQYLVADATFGGMPGDPRSDCLAYFRQAIETPGSAVPWHEWWQLHCETVRQEFSQRDYLALKYRKLAGAEKVLEQIGWHCPSYVDRNPAHTGCCPICNERLHEGGGLGGYTSCPNGCWKPSP